MYTYIWNVAQHELNKITKWHNFLIKKKHIFKITKSMKDHLKVQDR